MTARALRVACPFATCRAMPLFPCRNRDGEAMARPHSARVLAGDRAVLDRRLAARASISLSAAGYQAIKPYFDEMFLGRRPVAPTLAAAQAAANTAARR